ncbi:MAG: hypothetical protein Q8M76_19240, partial [Spirochaetaceae bacterium]|nr:hypothetical protein [Spirochaetaceae bacterium]
AWIHASLGAEREGFLETMYGAIAANDRWLVAHRDTRGSGCVEAFCAFDTGHDYSPRFWQVPDICYGEDPARFDPDCTVLPYLAPDLTANVHCQRKYLARIASSLSRDAEAAEWEAKAAASLGCLFRECWDAEDGFFYDRDRLGRFVRVQSDVLLRVLACEAGDEELFAAALSRYLLNSRKFFAKYPPTSIAMDDPRFESASDRNSWAGPTNVLSILRAPSAFEPRGRHVELSWILLPALGAYARMERFGQCLSPWTGEEGYTEGYTPAILGFLDAAERLFGILPRPDGRLWFTALPLPRLEGGKAERETTRYSRKVDGALFELESGPSGAVAYREGKEIFSCPRGVRVATDRSGAVLSLTGMVDRRVEGGLGIGGMKTSFAVAGNEVLLYRDGALAGSDGPGVVLPQW